MLAVSSEWSLTFAFTFALTLRLELPLEKEVWPWLWLELRLLNPLKLHPFKPGLFDNLPAHVRWVLDGARGPREPGALAVTPAADDEEGGPARSSKFLAPSTPYKTMVSRATWMYLNAHVITTTSSLVRCDASVCNTVGWAPSTRSGAEGYLVEVVYHVMIFKS